MAFLRVDPYASGEDAAASAAAAAERAQTPRAAALLATLVGGGLIAGAGLFVLGRTRRFLTWLAAGLGTSLVTLVAGLLCAPRIMFAGLAAALLVTVGALVDTARARPLRKPPIAPWLVVVGVAALATGVGIPLRASLLENLQVPSGSMMPTLFTGDRVLVSKVFRSVKRGDVVVFTHPTKPGTSYVRRVIGVGGDRVEMREGVIVLNGRELPQRELAEPCPEVDYPAACSFREETNAGRTYRIFRAVDLKPFAPPVEVPPGHIYVVGDDRDNSSDSRAWGTLPLENVSGRALFVTWSRNAEDDLRWERSGKLLR
jgi:signal peptidase I